MINAEEVIFGLDIGTRTIIGVVGYVKDDGFHILASKTIPHESRAMIDGQIHDIGKVAQTALRVKQELEEQTGMTFKKVAIAAAGRSLKTFNVSVEQVLDKKNDVIIDNELIKGLEIEALNKAQNELMLNLSEDDKYFCVGYSVVNYYLNGYSISNLEGHKGKRISIDILATFLPQVVVDSLNSVVEKIGLEVRSMTLEPIAAINVVIPENLRLLNLALVDVGAGTSDIAVTKEGSVFGYGMIPVAGDEITEQLVHTYLIDFNTAEDIKQKIGIESEVVFEDILGMSHTVTSDELMKVIEPTVDKLTSEIAAKISAVNGGKPTSAVFCVGGGSQVQGFVDKLSSKLGIDKQRVTLRGSEALTRVIFEDEKLEGTMYVTPIGICVTSAMDIGYEFLYVSVNGDIIELMKAKTLTLLDAAISKGFNQNNLINRKGANLLFRLNGAIKKVSGDYGTPAEIYLNDVPASLDSEIKADDKIVIVPAINGTPAQAFIKDFADINSFKTVVLNGTKVELSVLATINGNMVLADAQIQEDDEVNIYKIDTIKDLCKFAEIDTDKKYIYLDGELTDENAKIKDGSHIEMKSISNAIKAALENENVKSIEPKQVVKETPPVVSEIPKAEVKPAKIETPVQAQTEKFIENVMRGEEAMQVIVNGKVVIINDNKPSYVFVDIFNYIDFDLSHPKGLISLKLNGRTANYTEPLKSGDIIEITWEKI